MTLHQLKYIVAIDNFRHFATAANKCFVTQPTLSMQVQKLEEELGILIFDRTKQPVIPTGIGSKIIKQARIILREKEKIENIVESETGEFTGTLKIGIIPTVAPYLIPLFLESFTDNYPDIELVIDEITTDEIVEGIIKDFIDVGILALPINDSDIIEKSIYWEPFVGYIAKKHKLFNKDKLDIEDLNTDDILLLNEGHCLRGQILKLCKTTEREWGENSRKILFESGNMDTLKKLVEKNFGITLLPFLAVKDLDKKKQLPLVKEFNPPIPKREIGLVYSKAYSKKHLLKVLAEEIKNHIPEDLLEKENSLIIPVT